MIFYEIYINKYVYPSIVKLIDADVFTESKVWKWRDHILNSYEIVLSIMKKKIDASSSLKFFLSGTLVEEVIADAIIGMRKFDKVLCGGHECRRRHKGYPRTLASGSSPILKN